MNADRHGGRWVVAALCAIVALGVGLRVYAAAERADDRNDPVQDDSIRYYFVAQSLFDDQSFDAPEVERDEAYHPGSPLFHAGVWYLTAGENPMASRIVAALLSSLMILFTFLIARRLAWGPDAGRVLSGTSDRAPPVEASVAGLIAAFLIAVNPSSTDFYRSMMNEPLSSIVLIAAVLALLWASDSAPGRVPGNGGGGVFRWAVPGALIGLDVMFRPEAAVFGIVFAVLAMVYVAHRLGRNEGLKAAVVLLAAMALVLAPWTIRNATELGKPSPVTDGGGNALFIGTYLPGNGDHFETFDREQQLVDDYDVPASELEKLAPGYVLGDVLELIAERQYPELSQEEGLAKLGREQLEENITEHPVEYAGVLAEKFWNMWGQGAAAKPGQGGPGMLGDWFHLLVVLLGVIGLVLLAVNRRWEGWVLGSVLAIATVIGVVLLAPPRRNVDLLPLVSALAGYAAVTGWPGAQRVFGSIAAPITRSR